jgi:ribosomal peptide maturation radical SAM protein 1
MPWEALRFPSLQLGTLKAVLERAGYPTAVRSFYLALMEHLLLQTEGLPEPERISVADYAAVAESYWGVGMGDWIFTGPPYRGLDEELDSEYLGFLRADGVPEDAIAKAVQMRAIVPGFLEACAEDVLLAEPKVVGFTSSFSQNVPSLALAKLLKARDPSLRIVFGGANADGPLGAALHRAFPWVDVVVRREAERVAPGVIGELLEGRPVTPRPGLCYRENGTSVVVDQAGGERVPMDEVPLPEYDEYFERLRSSQLEELIDDEVEVLFEGSRGCWWGEKHHCTFCGLNGTSMAFRDKSAERVADEILALAARHGRLKFAAVDNIISMTHVSELLPLLREARTERPNLRVFYETKANLRRGQLELMRDAGVRIIQPGIESLSTPILKLMRKGVSALQNIRLLKWAAELEIDVIWNLIYGFPGEPAGEYARMAALMPALAHLQPPSLTRLSVQRFSPYHESPADFGIELLGPAPYYRFLYSVDDETLNDLAYGFDYAYNDGGDPSGYVDELRAAVERWHSDHRTAWLTYRREPGGITIEDRRPAFSPAAYSLDEAEAQLYLACEPGATARHAWESLDPDEGAAVTVTEVEEFLRELSAAGLIYEEAGRYLSLAVAD